MWSSARYWIAGRTEVVVVVLGHAGASLAGIAGLRILTTQLPPEAYGLLALGLSISAFLQLTIFGPISAASVRYAASAEDNRQLPEFIAGLRGLIFQAILFTAILVSVIVVILAVTGRREWIALLVTSAWFAVASGTSVAFQFMDVSLRNRGRAAGIQVSQEVARFAGAAGVLLAWPQLSANGAMAAFALVATAFATIQWNFGRSRKRLKTSSGAEWRSIIKRFALPLSLTGVLGWAQLASDRWSLNFFLSSADVGGYSSVYQFAVAPMSLLSVMLQQMIGPIVFRQAGRDGSNIEAYNRHLLVYLALGSLAILTLIGVVFAWHFHEVLFTIALGPDFRQYSKILPLAVATGGSLAASQLAGILVMSHGNTSLLITPKIITAIAGTAMNIAGARAMGVVGVLLANAAYGFMFTLWMLKLGNRMTKKEPKAV